jgi:hypothetical protein
MNTMDWIDDREVASFDRMIIDVGGTNVYPHRSPVPEKSLSKRDSDARDIGSGHSLVFC